MPEDGKTAVVFYDSCVPWKQFRQLIPEVISFAEHIFVRDCFSEDTCRDDRVLFGAVSEECIDRFPGKIWIFVTTDQTFLNQVGKYPSLEHISVIVAAPTTSIETNWIRARDTAIKIAEAYWEKKGRFEIASAKMRAEEALNKIFSKQTP